MRFLSSLLSCPCGNCPGFGRQWGAMGFLHGGGAPHLGLSNWVTLFAQHSVLLVSWLTDNCVLFVPAYSACGSSSSFTLGPHSVETKHFLAWVRLIILLSLGTQVSQWNFLGLSSISQACESYSAQHQASWINGRPGINQ